MVADRSGLRWRNPGTTDAPLSRSTGVRNGALRAAAVALLRRHPNLRAGFLTVGMSGSVQVVAEDAAAPWREVDISGDTAEAREERARSVAEEEYRRRFDMTWPPLVRFALLRLGARRHRLVMTGHHILWDGWSVPLMVRELAALYEHGDDAVLPPVASYRSYLAWLARQDRDAALTAWREALGGLSQPSLLAPATLKTNELTGLTDTRQPAVWRGAAW